jgi:hypothetical protein
LVEPEPHHADGARAGALTGCGSRGTVNFCSFVFLSSWQASSVADPDPAGSESFWSDPDPDIWDRIRILALINYHYSTFLVCVKA